MSLTTPPVRVSYPTVITPRTFQGGDGAPQYSIVLMFDKKNKEHKAFLKKLNEAAIKVKNEAWPNPDNAPRIPIVGHDKSPIKDADKNCNGQGVPLHEKNPEYAGHFIVRAASYDQPAVVDRDKSEIVAKNKVYGGCMCEVNINPYARKRKENPGISIGLNGVRFWTDGDSFGGSRPDVDDMFGDAESEDPGNYSDDEDLFGDGGEGAVKDPLDDDIPF